MSKVLPDSVLRPITKEHPYKIVFVCLGNICRSPTAEGVFQHIVKEQGLSAYFEIDSSGTSAYHAGEKADSRSREAALKHGVELLSRSRKFETFDLDYFDLIIPMDSQNKRDIEYQSHKKEHKEKVILMREFDELANGDINVPDPYYGGAQGFENVYQMVKRSSEELLNQLKPFIQ
ncbi:low molecular weight phosphotyrosine protein phosphatase [bacterium]|nr:MAG: low molecular weight phosphotyrosine protein phosphatase [bacterium]